ncbi:transketolase [Candidatus Pacearchaeota archaeon]|nr:transketolase [Candidatus Pacearchaeota archaeon]
MEIKELESLAKEARHDVANLLRKVNGSHIGGAYSVIDILTTLYFDIMNVNPKQPKMKERDKLIFSKGHAGIALYTILSKKGFFDREMLESYCQNGSPLEGHVNSYNVPGVELSTGSLGHGLPVGIGMALANKVDKNPGKVFVIMSDGECNEGSVWESAIIASRMALDNLTTIIDANGWQGLDSSPKIFGSEDKLWNIWNGFGFGIKKINGHNYGEITDALKSLPIEKGKPSLIYAHTIKGKGIPSIENTLASHYKTPTEEQVRELKNENIVH